MNELVVVLGGLATIAGGPIAAWLRTMLLRATGRGHLLIETADGVAQAEFRTDVTDQQVSEMVRDLRQSTGERPVKQGPPRADGEIEVVDRGRHASGGSSGQGGPSQVRPSKVLMFVVELIYGGAMLGGIAAKAAWDYSKQNDQFGIRWGDAFTAMLVAPIVYVGVGEFRRSSQRWGVRGRTVAVAGLRRG